MGEETAIKEYQAATDENEIVKTEESKSDRSGVNDELAAVSLYLRKIEDQCIEKAETYEDKRAKKAKEVAGLKQALDILETEAAFVQRRVTHRTLRGALHP